MPASTRRFASPLLFKWDANWGLDSQNRLWALSGNRVVTATFDRGGTTGAASQVDYNGRLFIPGYKTPRLGHYVSGSGPTLLLEGSRVNLAVRSSDVSNAAWTKSFTTIGSTTTAPDGSSAYLVYPASTGTNRQVYQTVATSAISYASSFWVKAAGLNFVYVGKADGSATGVWFNLATGAIGTTGAGCAGYISAGVGTYAGWYRCTTVSTGVAGTSYHACIVCDADGSTTATTSGTNGVYIGMTQFEAGAFPSSYIPTTSAAVTRAADACSWPFLAVPQAMTVYGKYYDLGSAIQGATTGTGIIDLGVYSGAAGTTVVSYISGGNVLTNVYAAGAQNTGGVTKAAYGELGEVRTALSADGSAVTGCSVNGGAESVGSASAANALTGSFRTAVLSVNTLGATVGFLALSSLKVAAGVQTLTVMRQL